MVACIALLSAVAVYLYMFYQREPYVDPYSHHYQVHPPQCILISFMSEYGTRMVQGLNLSVCSLIKGTSTKILCGLI